MLFPSESKRKRHFLPFGALIMVCCWKNLMTPNKWHNNASAMNGSHFDYVLDSRHHGNLLHIPECKLESYCSTDPIVEFYVPKLLSNFHGCRRFTFSTCHNFFVEVVTHIQLQMKMKNVWWQSFKMCTHQNVCWMSTKTYKCYKLCTNAWCSNVQGAFCHRHLSKRIMSSRC